MRKYLWLLWLFVWQVNTIFAGQNAMPVDRLLCNFPARNAIEQELLARAIIAHGESGMTELLRYYLSGNPGLRIPATYAVRAVVDVAGLPDQKKSRRMVGRAIASALHTDMSVDDTAFLLQQLQWLGDENFVKDVAMFLSDKQQCDPAARALVSIGGDKAGDALMKALKTAPISCQRCIIQALGDLRYDRAIEKLTALIDDEQVGTVALQALASIGSVKSFFPLQKAYRVGQIDTDTYLIFARRIMERQNPDMAIPVCREIYQRVSDNMNAQERIAALKLWVQLDRSNAWPHVQDMLLEGTPAERHAAIELAQKVFISDFPDQWMAMADAARPVVQAGMIPALAGMPEEVTRDWLIGKLDSDFPIVQIAALRTLYRLYGESAMPIVYEQFLRRKPAGVLIDALQEILTTLPVNDLTIPARSQWPGLSLNVKLALMNIWGTKRAQQTFPYIQAALHIDSVNVRKAAWQAISGVAAADDVPDLFDIFLREADGAVKRKAARTLAQLVKEYKLTQQEVKRMAGLLDTCRVEMAVDILNLLKRLGDERSLDLVRTCLADTSLAGPSRNVLLAWPNAIALDDVLAIASAPEIDETTRVLAMRSALQLLQRSKMDPIRAVGYYKRLMNLTTSAYERQMVLGGLGTLSGKVALKYAMSWVMDDSVGYEAAVAAVNITRMDDDGNDINPEAEVTAAILQSIVPELVKARIDSTPLLPERHNQPPEGFTALFNGIDLTGWKGLVENPVAREAMNDSALAAAQARADSIMRAHWYVVDGVLCFDGHGQSLCTARDYANFELLLDWKIEKDGDSGIYLRGTPQVQIWDADANPVGSGGLFNNQKHPSEPLVRADKPVGEWNHFRIIMIRDKVTVYLNDQLVVDRVVLENYWDRTLPVFSTGQIELQAHHSPLYFRNIYIRELPDEAMPYEGLLFNGTDLSGWQVISNKPDSWHVKDGILYTEGDGDGWISTNREYSDFELELEFRVPPGGNSGVFIRAPHEGNPAYAGMEIQVLDDAAPEHKDLKPWQYTGSIYGLVPPAQRISRPANEWQSMKIRCKGPYIRVTLNGIQIVDANLIDYMHATNTHPGIKRRSGYIGLQNHSKRVEYRNIRIREL